MAQVRDLTDLETQGLIQGFEYTHELACNTLKDYLEYQGDSSIKGSRDATRAAFKRGFISDGEGWMDMIKNRNQTSYTYNEETAKEISSAILESYYGLFSQLRIELEKLIVNSQNDLFDRE